MGCHDARCSRRRRRRRPSLLAVHLAHTACTVRQHVHRHPADIVLIVHCGRSRSAVVVVIVVFAVERIGAVQAALRQAVRHVAVAVCRACGRRRYRAAAVHVGVARRRRRRLEAVLNGAAIAIVAIESDRRAASVERCLVGRAFIDENYIFFNFSQCFFSIENLNNKKLHVLRLYGVHKIILSSEQYNLINDLFHLNRKLFNIALTTMYFNYTGKPILQPLRLTVDPPLECTFCNELR